MKFHRAGVSVFQVLGPALVHIGSETPPIVLSIRAERPILLQRGVLDVDRVQAAQPPGTDSIAWLHPWLKDVGEFDKRTGVPCIWFRGVGSVGYNA